MLKMHDSFPVSMWSMKYASIAVASLSWNSRLCTSGGTLPCNIDTYFFSYYSCGACTSWHYVRQCQVIVYFILYAHTSETCNVSILHLHVEDRVMWFEMMIMARVRTQDESGIDDTQIYSSCVPGGPGYKQIYRSQHRQMEGANCPAVSYLWKRMSLHSYDSILLDSTAYLSDTRCIHHSARCHFLITFLFSMSDGATV
jgi:hypothetical protein